MKHNYFSQTKRSFFTKAFIAILFLHPSFVHAEIYTVQLYNYSACGGATLVPFCFYTGSTATPVTIYYERLGAANSWLIEGTQVYNSSTSYIQYNGSDLTSTTAFRVRALDEITGNIYISNSVSVDPAKWNIDRGTAFSTAYASWGGNCGSSNYINIETNALTNGRPPFTMQYKKTSETTYTGAGETTGYGQIPNIEWGSNYDVKITDRCGKIVNLNTRLYLSCSYGDLIPPTGCNKSDGSVTLYPSTDSRYVGVPPYTYNVRKPGNATTDTAFVSNNVFSNLSPGTYDYSIRDACGHTSSAGSIVIGSATPTGYANSDFDPLDSCFINIDITATAGTAPLQFGISRFDTSHFTFSSSHNFKVSDPGLYYFRIIDACGNRNRDQYTYVVAAPSTIDSVRTINNGCFKDIVVYAAYGLKPYQYIMSALNPPYTVIKQSSDTFRNVAPNIFIFSIENRCGRTVAQANWVYDTIACRLRTDTGSFQSQNTSVGCANLSGNEWTDITDDKGNLIYSINPNGNVMNNVCWGVHVENGMGKSLRADTMNGTPAYFLDRNFYIEPPANLVLTDSVSVRIYFTDAELQNMLGYLYDSIGVDYRGTDLRILKKKGSPGSPVDLEVTNDTIANQSQFTILTPTLMPYGKDWYMEFKVKDFSEFNPYIGELTILPLQLLSFTAKTINKEVKLSWQTANEVNTKNFAVQWSKDGTLFTTIGNAAAKGSGANNYSFLHNTPVSSKNFYRLQQMDKDGTTTYSKIISTDLVNEAKIVLAPNPVHDKLLVSFPSDAHFRSATVYNVMGGKLIQKMIPSSATQVDLSLLGLSNGMYMILLDGDKKQSVPFIKQ